MPWRSDKIGVAEPRAHGMRDEPSPDNCYCSDDDDDDVDGMSFGPQSFLEKLAAVAEQEARGTTDLRASFARMRSRNTSEQPPPAGAVVEPEPQPESEPELMEPEPEPGGSGQEQAMYLLRTKSKRRRNSRKSEQLHAFINTVLVGLGSALVLGLPDEGGAHVGNLYVWATRLTATLAALLCLFCVTEGCQVYICPGKPKVGQAPQRDAELGDSLLTSSRETWAAPRCKSLSRTRSRCTDVVCLAFCGACMCYCVFVSHYLDPTATGRPTTAVAGGALFELGALGLLSLGFGLDKPGKSRTLGSASSLERKTATQRRNTMLFVNLVACICTSLVASGVAFNATALTIVEAEEVSSGSAHLIELISLSVTCLAMSSALISIKLLTIEGVVVKVYFCVASIVLICSIGFVLAFAPIALEVQPEDNTEILHLQQSVKVAVAVVMLNLVEAIVVCYRNEAPTLMLMLSCGWLFLGVASFVIAAAAKLQPKDADAVSREVSSMLWYAQGCNDTAVSRNETRWKSAASLSRHTLGFLQICDKFQEGFEVVAAGGFVVGVTSIVRAICLSCRRYFAQKDRLRTAKREQRRQLKQQRKAEAEQAEIAARELFAQHTATLQKGWATTKNEHQKKLAATEAQAQEHAAKAAKAEEQAAQDRALAANARQLQAEAAEAQKAKLQAEEAAAAAKKDADAARQAAQAHRKVVWECDVDGTWHPYPEQISQSVEQAYLNHGSDPSFTERGQTYSVDMKGMRQVNTKTGFARSVRRRLVGKHPANWTAQPAGQNCVLVDVSPGTVEYNAVRDRMRTTMREADRQIQRVQRIQNVLLWEYYCMRKDLMKKRSGSDPNEVTVWHGTRATDPKIIYSDTQDGFMMQYSAKGMWGTGIYFAENASYSDSYANTAHSGAGQRSFFLAKLLAGEEVDLPSDSSLRVCPAKPGGGRYDTVTGTTGGSKVYIVYENGRAYPEYLVTYRR